MSRFRILTLALLVVVLTLIGIAAFAATDTSGGTFRIDWVKLVEIVLPAFGALFIQSPWIRGLAGKIQKLAPDWNWEDALKLEKILRSALGLKALLKWVRAYDTTLLSLLLALLMCGFLVPTGQCQGLQPAIITHPTLQFASIATNDPPPSEPKSILGDTTSFGVAYAHSFKNSQDGLIGQLSVNFLQKELAPGKVISVSVDLNAVPLKEGGTRFGIGGSVMLSNGVIGLGIGAAYLPDPFGWSWTVNAVKWSP